MLKLRTQPNKKSSHFIDDKRDQEKFIVEKMIKIYCHGHHHSEDGLCPECQDLFNYSVLRINRCPFMATKSFCANCKVHCYKADMREKIRVVMRYSGPRMLFHHPILTIKHMVEERKDKRMKEKAEKFNGKQAINQ